jgi:5-methylthioadenosine/S-adenosylhomocysteine deaminase
MRTLIRNVTAITLAENNPVLTQASITLEGGQILSVGSVAAGFLPDETIQGEELVAMPAFFNAHTHAAMTLERGWAEDLPFERWLNEKIWAAESALEEEDVYWGTALAAAEMIRSGCVGFADHYFWMDQAARVVEESGMKALLAWCHFGLCPAQELGGKSFEDTMAFAARWNGAASGRIHTAAGPHSPYMDSPAVLRRFASEALRLGIGAHLHLSESLQQVTQSRAQYGLTPTALVAETGLFDLPAPTLAAHCNALEPADFELLASKGVYVAHAPKTYQKLAMQMPSLVQMLAHGIHVALGTDGPASNSDLNLLEVLRLAGLYHKSSQSDATVLPVMELLRLATAVPAAAMGFRDSGILAAGRPADLILIDTRAPHWIPRHNLAAGVVYTSHPDDVAYVWCGGRLLYRRGEFLTLDYERIRHEAEKRSMRMVGKPLSTMRTAFQ